MDLLDLSSIDGSQGSIYNSLEDHGREILILQIDVGNGNTEELAIRENDTPKFIAKEFCRKHKLNPEAEKVLVEVIKGHLRVKPVVEVSMMVEKSEKKEEIINHLESFRSKHDTKEDFRHRVEKSFPDQSKLSRASHRQNFGERLYNEGLQLKEKHEKKISEMRELKDRELMREITFKPNIMPERQMPRLQFLGSDGKASAPVDRFEALYKKSKKPGDSLSQKSSPSMSQKILNSRKGLQLYLEQREKDQSRLQPGKSKSPSMLTRDRSKKNYRSQSQDRKVKLSNEQTDKILHRIKTIRFIQLFEQLNPSENQINKFTVIDAKLSNTLQRILAPFITELSKLRKGLNLEQFCKVMDLYIKELTPEDRGLLLQTSKKKASEGCSKGITQDLGNDLWSPKHEEKLFAFDNFPEY